MCGCAWRTTVIGLLLTDFLIWLFYRTFAVGARGLLRLLLHEGFSAAAFSLWCREVTYSFPSWLLFFRCCHYANTWLISSQALKFCQYHEYCIQNVYFIVIKSAFSSNSCFADFSCSCKSAFSSDSCFADFFIPASQHFYQTAALLTFYYIFR